MPIFAARGPLPPPTSTSPSLFSCALHPQPGAPGSAPFYRELLDRHISVLLFGVLRGRSSGIGHGVLRGTRIRLSLDNRGQCGFLPNVSKRSSGRLRSSPEDRLSREHLRTNSLTLQMQKLAVRGDGGTRSRVTVEIGAVPSATL